MNLKMKERVMGVASGRLMVIKTGGQNNYNIIERSFGIRTKD